MIWVQLNDGYYRNKIDRGPNRLSDKCILSSPNSPTASRRNSKRSYSPVVTQADSHKIADVSRSAAKIWSTATEDSIDHDLEKATKVSPERCSLTVRCSKPFNFSVQEYSSESLSIASHSTSLHRCSTMGEDVGHILDDTNSKQLFASKKGGIEGLFLNIDPFMMGVGGDDSWSACVHEEFTLQPDVYSFKVSISFHYR